MARKKKTPEVRLPAITQLPSGAWHTRVLLDGRRVSITKNSYDECVAEYLALKNGIIESKAEKGKHNKTLRDAVNHYIDSRRGYRSPSTICAYERYRDNTFQTMMGVNVYTATDEQWQSAIQREKKNGHSPKYIKNAWALVASAIEAETKRRPSVMLYPKDPNPRAYLEPDQIDIFVDAIKGTDIEIPALLCLSSLRRSEMLALKWENVDLRKKILHIRGAIVQGSNGMEYKPRGKTGKSRRTVPIIPPLYDALSSASKKGEFVVSASPITLSRHLKKICVDAGLPEVGMHGLRHSFASLAYHLQMPEMIAAEIGGWNDLATMHKIYTHLSEKDVAQRGRQFADFFTDSRVQERKLATELETESEKP